MPSTHYERAREALDRADAVPSDAATYHVLRALVYAVLDVSNALVRIAGENGVIYTRDADRV